MGLNAYTDSGKNETKVAKKATKVVNKVIEPSEKEYKSYYLSKSTIDLINKVSLTKKIADSKYSHDDAIREAFVLLAKEIGV